MFFDAIYSLELFILMFIIKKYLFMEFENEEQRKRTKLIFAVGVCVVFLCAGVDVMEYFCPAFLLPMENIIRTKGIVYTIITYMAVSLSSYSVRKKYKWIGFFVVFPIIGYLDIIIQFFDAFVPNRVRDNFRGYILLIPAVLLLICFVVNRVKPRAFETYQGNIEKYDLPLLIRWWYGWRESGWWLSILSL